MALPQDTMRRHIALRASDEFEKLTTNSDELTNTGVRFSSCKFVVDVIVTS
jgi:hypothetical protein